MRRESHRRRGVSRASSGGWGHRAVYIGAVVATAAVIAGFGSAVLIYGPIGAPYRQLSGSQLGAPPTGVSFGSGVQVLASGLPAYNVSSPNQFDVGGYSNVSSICNASGVWSPGLTAVGGATTSTGLRFSTEYGNITAGNTTVVCLNSVGETWGMGTATGFVNSTWSQYLQSNDSLVNAQGATWIPDAQTYNNTVTGQNVSSCNNFTAPVGAPSWDSPWNSTHVYNSSFVPCNTYYQMNNNTSYLPSFDGVVSNVPGALPPDNSTAWVVNESGYMASDVVFEVPVIFTANSTNGTFEISIAIAGVTPVAQTFYLNNSVQSGAFGAASGTVVFVFDMTAAWLYDATYNYSAMPTPTTAPEIYGAIGLTSIVVTECSGTGVCPTQS